MVDDKTQANIEHLGPSQITTTLGPLAVWDCAHSPLQRSGCMQHSCSTGPLGPIHPFAVHKRHGGLSALTPIISFGYGHRVGLGHLLVSWVRSALGVVLAGSLNMQNHDPNQCAAFQLYTTVACKVFCSLFTPGRRVCGSMQKLLLSRSACYQIPERSSMHNNGQV